MSRLKRFISTMLAFCLCLTCISILPVSADEAVDASVFSLQNSGFEDPVISGTYQQKVDSDVPYWSTTAHEKKIELFKANTGTYITGKRLEPKAGLQAAELNADEASSLYQSIQTTPGSFLKWGISHHGRNGYDTMLLVIGPKQDVNPAKKIKTGYDQFMKMGQYIHSHSEYSGLIPTDSGASRKITLYSPKFAANGDFENGENAAFTANKTSVNTEQWNIWFIKSNNDKWYDYGTNKSADTSELGYSNLYEVPEGQKETILAFTAYESAPKSNGTVDLTYGNMIDDINFGILYNVSLHTLAGGSGKVTAENTDDLSVSYTGTELNSAKYQANSKVLLTVTPDVDKDYIFAGATINGTFYGYDAFNSNNNTEFTKEITVDESKYIKLFFAKKGYMSYDPNGGTFKGTTAITDKTFDFYSNAVNETESPSHSSAVFTGWTLYTNADAEHKGIVIPKNHNISYSAQERDENNALHPYLTISWDESGSAKSVKLSATEEDGILLVANYNFKHEVIALTDGGSVDIENTSNKYEVVGGKTDKYTSGGEGDVITVAASPSSGYQFDGWFETENGEAVSRALQYSYVVTDNSKIYAKFSKETAEDGDGDLVFKSDYAYIYGHNETTMAAEENLLRGQASSMIYRLVKQSGLLGDFVYDENKEPAFDDIGGKWYRSAIEYMNHKGAFPQESEVYPNMPVTRGELFKIVCLGLNFTDKTDLSYNDYAMLLYNAKYIQGDQNGNLNIEDLITRAEFCAVYNRITGRDNARLVTADGTKVTGSTYRFTDLDEGQWYYEDVLRATSAYDDNGYVDIELRNHRNILDDYNPNEK